MKKSLFETTRTRLSTHNFFVVLCLGVSYLLYIAGITFLLPLSIVGVIVLYLPFPKIFNSLLSRVVVALLAFYSLFQFVSVLQFTFFIKSNFDVPALIITLMALIAALVFPHANHGEFKVKNTVKANDIWAASVAFLFFMPLALLSFGPNGNLHTTSIGGIQGVDGANHYVFITESNHNEHMSYNKDYYPIGFHLTTAFLQNASTLSQDKVSWNSNAKIYIAQYLIFGVILAYMLFYLCLQLASNVFVTKLKRKPSGLLIAVGLCPVIGLFYLLPFFYNGFLNYYYASAALVVALIYFVEFSQNFIEKEFTMQRTSWRNIGMLFTGLLFIFGTGMSWPLLMPPVVITGLLFLIPHNPADINFKYLKQFISPKSLVILAGLGLQLIPIYLQLRYSSLNTGQIADLAGSLRVLHVGILIAGIVFLLAMSISTKVSEKFKQLVSNILLPLYGLIGLMAALQYFQLGEARYYLIKTVFLVEMIVFVSIIAYFVAHYENVGTNKLQYIGLIALLPTTLLMLTTSINDVPFKDVRSLFRTYSKEAKPQFFDSDVKKYTQLGEEGDIKDFANTVLHYDNDKQKFYAHMQISYWSSTMQYSVTPEVSKLQSCMLKTYKNQLFGTFSETDQSLLVKNIRQCAVYAKDNGDEYYIVTDKVSASRVQDVFGDVATVVW